MTRPAKTVNRSALFHKLVDVITLLRAMSALHGLLARGRASVFGMIHVSALPGTPRNRLQVSDILTRACTEARTLVKHGVDGLILENTHDVPYSLTPGPEVTAAMTVICASVRELCQDIPLGVQILAGANQAALAVAQAAKLDFIRAEGFVFAHVADEGFMQACAGELLRYRRNIGAENVRVFTDIKKKHSSHSITGDVSLGETGHAAEFFLSDGLIVTGVATGSAARPDDVTDVKAASSLPVLVGSGVTHGNLEKYMKADGLIVGSDFKRDGDWRNELDERRIEMFMNKFRKLT